MDSMPGGGAEIFSERVRRIICDHKLSGDQWIDVARTAHKMGIHSNCTRCCTAISRPRRTASIIC